MRSLLLNADAAVALLFPVAGIRAENTSAEPSEAIPAYDPSSSYRERQIEK